MSTYEIDRYLSPIPEDVCLQVLRIAEGSVTSLMQFHPPEDHPEFPVLREAFRVEIYSYLDMGQDLGRIDVVTASVDGRVVGFLMSGLPLNGSSSEANIYYIAVAKAHRRRGVLGLMMQDVIERYGALSLSCDVALVPVYERFGFKCQSLRNHQIVMVRGNPYEDTPVFTIEDLMGQPGVVEENRKVQRRHSRTGIERARQAHARTLWKWEREAIRFFKQLGEDRKAT